MAACASQPKAVGRLQKVLYERYPTVTVVNVADVLEIVQDVVDQVALVTRFVSAFAILAGAVILASSVAGTRFRRVREVAILKTVGATRRRVAAHLLGRVPDPGRRGRLDGEPAGVGILRAGAQPAVPGGDVPGGPAPNLVAIALTALVAVAAGWLASARILGRKPLEVLRGE